MKTSRSDDKQRRTAHIDHEKSTDDIFEHVIRGVRLSRLLELLRRRKEHDEPDEGRSMWGSTPAPRTA